MTALLERPQAQELLDAFAAIGLCAAAIGLRRRAPASTLRPRLSFLFGALCAFYTLRAAAGATASQPLVVVMLVVACVLPLAATLLVEGVLRRHAPVALKVFVTFGGAIAAIAQIVAAGREPVSSLGLGSFVVLSLVCVVAIIVARDRRSLSRQENANLDALAAPAVLVTLATVTDFIASAPIGLSGAAATTVAFAFVANPASSREARAVAADIVLIVAIATAAALGLAFVLALGDVFATIRLAAILVVLLMASTEVLRLRRVAADGDAFDFVGALANADLSNLDAFLNDLAESPLLAGLRIAEGAQLAEYDCANLASVVGTHPVWTRAQLADPHTHEEERAFDELGDLMKTAESTHAVALAQDPLRIALLTLPAGNSEFVEIGLAQFGRLARIAARAQR